jgi:O-acetyl-ADP-ribose deacetylase (regulator of RNase III)
MGEAEKYHFTMNTRPTGSRIAVVVGDITLQAVDAIVNAANSSLLGGGGVDGAIHRAGGPAILAECRRIREMRYPEGLPTGEAVITTAGRLPAKHVIHTVGPIYGQHGGDEARLLAACYENSIALAATHGLATIAFPAISTGVYGYPKEEAARVSRDAVERELRAHPSISQVRLVFFSDADASIAKKLVSETNFPESGSAPEIGL